MNYQLRLTKPCEAAVENSEIICADDGAALTECFELLTRCTSVEAWDGDRLVCRMTRAGHLLAIGPTSAKRKRPAASGG